MFVVQSHYVFSVSCRGRSPSSLLFYMHVFGSELDMYKHEAQCDWIEWQNTKTICKVNLKAQEVGLWLKGALM